DELWDRYPGHVSSARPHPRPNPQGREARRPAGRTVHQIRVFDQPADGQGTWPRRAQLDPIARRPADRIAVPFVASAHGRSWHETAVLCVPANVCSWGKSGRAADITAMTNFEPSAVFGSIHRTCLSPLDAMGRAARKSHHRRRNKAMELPHATAERLEQIPRRSRTRRNIDCGDRDEQSSWLVAGIVPGVERQPLKKLTTDQDALLQLLHRWRKEANEAGHVIKRITVAYEAGRDGFWLARWLRAHEIEAYVIHPSSVPVSREH